MSLKKDEKKILDAVVDTLYENLNVKDRPLTINEINYVVSMALVSLASYRALYKEFLNDSKVR